MGGAGTDGGTECFIVRPTSLTDLPERVDTRWSSVMVPASYK